MTSRTTTAPAIATAPRAFAYVRVSTAEQARDGATSIDTQVDVCEVIAKLHGLDVPERFADLGVSGSVPMADRPAGARLLATVQRGDMVIASKMDRAFRDAGDALNVAKALEKQGVRLVLRDVSADPINGNGVGKLVFTLLAAVAEMERDRIRERMMDGRAGKVARGGHGGGEAPYGWRIVGSGREAMRERDEAEQAVITKAKALQAAGMSYTKIAATLGNVSRAGTPLTVASVSRMLAAAIEPA
jgi:DNA invertase Pin-like site-specific DNA recombinase